MGPARAVPPILRQPSTSSPSASPLMPAIKQASILQLKARVDIVDVVSTVVALKRAGSKFKGLSPFNPEKTPSFYVSPEKGLFKCFSSGKAGDVISFVMETERLGFTEAVETLARRYNIPLEYESGGISREERSLRQQLFELHEEATQFFHDAFRASAGAGPFAREYWTTRRRFDLAVAEDFKIGIAAPDGGRLAEHLQKKGYAEEALRQSGLFYVRQSGGLSPRFRGRLMIPIRDHQGRVVAFTARQLEITPADDPTHDAKYVNSPETPVFTKGQLLFNLDRARHHAGPEQPFLMVEGQLDAIRCFTAGLTATIAPQGTGVTDTQLRLLHRYDAGLECLLDGDSAGQKAALRLLPLALKEGLEVRFLPLAALGAKIDPDELVRDRGAEAIHELRRHPVSAMAFATGALAPDPQALSAQQTADICGELFAIIREAQSEVAQSGYLAEVAKLLHLNRTALETDYRRFRESADRRASFRAQASAPAPAPSPTSAPPPRDDDEPLPEAPEGHPGLEPDDSSPATSHVSEAAGQTSAFASVEQDVLLLLLHFESLGKALAQNIHHEWINTRHRAGRLLDRFLNDFAHDLWPGAKEVESVLEEPEDRNFVASLLFDPPPIDEPIKVANDGIRRMVSNFCDPRLRKIELEIAAKQGKFDADLILLLKTTEELRRLKLNPPLIRHPV